MSDSEGKLRVKVHNVYHDSGALDNGQIDTIENRIEAMLSNNGVVDVRIAPGDANSPLFLVFDEPDISVKLAKRMARAAVREFGGMVEGVDVERTISDSNVRIKTV